MIFTLKVVASSKTREGGKLKEREYLNYLYGGLVGNDLEKLLKQLASFYKLVNL